MREMWIIVPVVAVSGFYFMVMVIVMVSAKGRQDAAKMRTEVQTRMIDKFSSAPEFVTFLQSEQGKKFVTSFEETPRAHARERITSGVTRSIVLTVLGLAFLAINLTEARDEGFVVAGAILFALGIGSTVATFVTFRMSRSWGLLPPQDGASTDTRP